MKAIIPVFNKAIMQAIMWAIIMKATMKAIIKSYESCCAGENAHTLGAHTYRDESCAS
jgi:hypothetical protein